MKNIKLIFILFLAVLFVFTKFESVCAQEKLFTTTADREEFAQDISSLVETAWRKWQDDLVVNDIDVDGSKGVLSVGDIKGPVLNISLILEDFDRKDKSQQYIDCVRAVASALSHGMRLWQRGYYYDNIPFPQGASCVYTMPPSYNVPVMLATGSSTGDVAMRENSLYNFMLYRIPYYDENVSIVLRATARALSRGFVSWKNSCYIEDILAEGGVAPSPAPMGTGPGMVRGAKGKGGKITGGYFDGNKMLSLMKEDLTIEEMQEMEHKL